MIKRIFHCIICCASLYSQAQSEFRFRNYTINDGLSQSSVLTVLQDDLNALWIGTQDGLNRFDGKTFEIFNSDEIVGIESEYIQCSTKDRGGDLWFGTGKGLLHYSQTEDKFKTYSTEDKTALNIVSIAEDSKGNLWVATAESGLFRFNIEKKKFEDYFSMVPVKKLTNVAVSEKGVLTVSTESEGLFLCNLFQKRAIRINVPAKIKGQTVIINRLILGRGETVLLATNQGAYLLDLTNKKLEQQFVFLDRKEGFQNISDIYEENGVGWLITTKNNGLFVVDGKGSVVHNTEDIFQKTALIFNELNLIYKDRSGTFWIGSQRGVSSFNPLAKGILGVGPTANLTRGIPSANVWSFAEEKESEVIFIGTDKGVSRQDKKTGLYTQYERKGKSGAQSSGETTVLCMQVLSNNKLLVGCADGFFELTMDGSSHNYKQIQSSKKSEFTLGRVYGIVHWKDNLYWLATKTGAVLYNQRTKDVTFFVHDVINPKKTISKGVCRLVYKDLFGNVWFATSAGGLNTLNENGNQLTIQPYEKNNIIKAISNEYIITTIFQERRGVYWIGTVGAGLIKWETKNEKTTVYNKTNGLPNNVIYAIVSGGTNSLWMSTNKGLCNLNTSTLKIRNYTEIDGLMSNEFNLGASMQSFSGTLYFGGIYGYNYFNPEELVRTQKDIHVVFTKFKLENDWLTPNEKGSPLKKPIFLTNELELSYLQRSFTLKFQSSDLSNPEQTNYKYVLDGSEGGEVLIGTQNEIRFISLSPGSYTLKIYARSGTGDWCNHPATISLIIAAPFWGRWWFWLIAVAVVAISVRLIVRQRIAASRREQIRLELKIRDRTKEIQDQNIKIERQRKKLEEERNKVVEQQRLLQIEKDKTEKLLRNVIPASTAEELKKSGKARARGYKTVSVLFTDFVGFTKISDRMKPSELVKKLDVYFTKFDEIIVKNNLEKIKTIGDAYMCAGGVPVRNNTNPIDTCLAALQIQDYILNRKNDALANGDEYWELRLGINTGEVTAGVIGSERLAFDIWGTTVNQAQRMEMLGKPGKVTITGATFSFIEPYFECTFLGKAQTKSSGMVEMYVVDSIKPELSINGEGMHPNDRFNQIVNLHLYSSINYYKAERYINKTLEQRLSDQLHYHSIGHTKDVVKAVERLALLENVTDEGLFLLKSAASYHDAGFVEKYEHNEPVGARMAEEVLPNFGYTEKHIEQIKTLIYVTEIPHNPKNKLEEIICDADLDYLGRDDFHEIADRLRRELKEHGKIESDRQWDEIQVKFLTTHKYFTQTAIDTRRKKKLENLADIKARLEKDDYKD